MELIEYNYSSNRLFINLQYGELSLTTNPAFNLYSTPQRLSNRTSANIYTRVPGCSYNSSFESHVSPTSPYTSATTCTIPLLGNAHKKSNGKTDVSGCLSTEPEASFSLTSSGKSGFYTTLPHCEYQPKLQQHEPQHQEQHKAESSSMPLTSSLTSSTITIGAAQSLLTTPRFQAYGTTTVVSPNSMRLTSPLRMDCTSSALLRNVNYETIAS